LEIFFGADSIDTNSSAKVAAASSRLQNPWAHRIPTLLSEISHFVPPER
jgi:hypothetical protein